MTRLKSYVVKRYFERFPFPNGSTNIARMADINRARDNPTEKNWLAVEAYRVVSETDRGLEVEKLDSVTLRNLVDIVLYH